MSRDADRTARGDWQTPPALAREVVSLLARRVAAPAAVVEPTCGAGAFLAAAAAFPDARLLGVEIDPGRLAEARAALRSSAADLRLGDFFDVDWKAEFAATAGRVLAVGNPPWVTSAALGAIGRSAGPARSPLRGARGLDAVTGRSNFDVAEAVLARLLDALLGRPEGFVVAALCKTSVARRLLAAAERGRWPASGAAWGIDARAHFGASVEACLLLVEGAPAAPPTHRWPWYDRLSDAEPSRCLGVLDGAVVADPGGAPPAPPEAASMRAAWRSGVKHDCAAVMELRVEPGGRKVNGLGEPVDVERDFALPLRKCTDLARGRGGRRLVVVTQRRTGEDTAGLAAAAPRLWAYLNAHAARLDSRRSAVYRGRPRFCLFGVGPYAFALHKVAVSGLHPEPRFVALGPEGGMPVLLDDASYFLPFDSAEAAEHAARVLNGAPALAFLASRSHVGAKRPVTKALLDALTGAPAA